VRKKKPKAEPIHRGGWCDVDGTRAPGTSQKTWSDRLFSVSLQGLIVHVLQHGR
jgi:hypothetical protein